MMAQFGLIEAALLARSDGQIGSKERPSPMRKQSREAPYQPTIRDGSSSNSCTAVGSPYWFFMTAATCSQRGYS
jgi:hypothetical protein